LALMDDGRTRDLRSRYEAISELAPRSAEVLVFRKIRN
jgi:hypothetical protein